MDLDVPVPPQYQASPLKGVQYNDLLSVLNFVYHGEVHVAQKELKSFLTLAGKLGVIGFTPSITKPYQAITKPSYPSLASAKPVGFASPWVLPSPATTELPYPTLPYLALPCFRAVLPFPSICQA